MRRSDWLIEGSIVKYENKVWRVGLVNESRARLDPLTGTVVQISAASGRSFTGLPSSVNIGPTSMLPTVSPWDLNEEALARFRRMEGTELAANIASASKFGPDIEDSETEESNVASAAVTTAKTAVQKNKDRIAGLKAAKAAKAAAPKAPRVAKSKEQSKCKCGCGGLTGGNFVPGHDARFKGWLIKIAKGEMAVTDLKKEVREAYKWVKSSKGGQRPTTNYNGEALKETD